MESFKRHLDLGSGLNPRNPLRAQEIFGLDIRGTDSLDSGAGSKVLKWNAIGQRIPFPDHFFSSCSAFDFLEHVPRLWPAADGISVSFPFVDLMSEIYRVLMPGGILLAATPVYPSLDALTDPTHVNFLTVDSHRYFCGFEPGAQMYGFRGSFHAELVEVGLPHFLYGSLPSLTVRRGKVLWRKVRGRPATHLLWRLRAA
jgi:SAM-dependent methyltransferase